MASAPAFNPDAAYSPAASATPPAFDPSASYAAAPPTQAQPIQWPLTKQAGESDVDFYKRAAAVGKQVTPEQIKAETAADIKKVPKTLAVAALAGPVMLGSQVALPAAAFDAAGGGVLGGAAAGATGGAATSALTTEHPFSKEGLEDMVAAAVGGGAVGAGLGFAGEAAPSVSKWWNKLTGYTEDLEKAKNANLSKYMLEEQEGAQKVAAGQQAQNAARDANVAKYLKLEQEAEQGISEGQKSLAAVKAAQPTGPAGNWANLNQAIGTPSNAIRVGKGVADVAEGYGIPGRGLAQEGFDPATLSKMNPAQQAAAIGPKWSAAGKAVGDIVDKATKAGTKFDVGDSAFSILKKIPNPDLQDKAIELFNDTAKDLGITNTRQATPEQAWKLRQALKSSARFGPTGDLSSVKGVGTQLYRAVSGDLHNAVPGMADVDLHYGDMTEAVSAVQRNVAKYIAGKWTPPVSPVEAAAAKIPQMPTSAPYHPLPAVPGLPNVSPYTPLPTARPYTMRTLGRAGIGASGLGGVDYGYHKLKDMLGGGQ